MDRDITRITCKLCGKAFRFFLIVPLLPAPKKEEDVCCPYCGTTNGSFKTNALVIPEKIEDTTSGE